MKRRRKESSFDVATNNSNNTVELSRLISNQQQRTCRCKQSSIARASPRLITSFAAATTIFIILSSVPQVNFIKQAQATGSTPSGESGLKFDPELNAYSGLTFTFDPRLDKRVEWLHSEHWQAIMQQTSSLLHESLNGRAHLGEVRVLIPYKWRNFQWPLMQKPGSPIMSNRRLRYLDSDVIVGFEGK